MEETYFRRAEVKRDIVDSIEMFYKSWRHQSTLGHMPPMEFAKQQYWKKAAEKIVYFYLTTSTSPATQGHYKKGHRA